MTQDDALTILQSGRNVFLTGAAGAGKTYVLNQFIAKSRLRGHEVAVTASTGIAATHINGMTLHSWSGIGIKDRLSAGQIKDIAKNGNIASRMRKTDTLIIDEVSMISANVLDMVDEIARYIRKSKVAFGGMQVVLCGDFFQLPPISRERSVRFAFESHAWMEMQPEICYLKENHRQGDDSLLDILNTIRSNNITESLVDTLQDKVESISDDSFHSTKLFTHNVDVDKMNEEHLKQLEDTPQTYTMNNFGEKRIIQAMMRGCLAPEILQLKIGAAVMFVKNNLMKGYVNGTLGEVVDFNENNEPIVQLANGKEIAASAETWTMKDGDDILAEITQVPLRLAWAITIHKSQGMSLDSAEIDLRKCFLPGMGYVALSRVRSLDGLALKGFNPMALQVDQKILAFDKKISRER